MRLMKRNGVLNRAGAVAAIRKLRSALAPFATGAMDPETTDVLLGAFLGTFTTFEAEAAMVTLGRVDAMLADRERELMRTNIPPAHVRERQRLCGVLADALQTVAADMTRAERARFLARALDAASVPHDDPDEHPERLIPNTS